MENRIRKSQRRKKLRYDIIIIFFVILAVLQFWTLRTFYKELKLEIPQSLFKSFINFPITENIIGKEVEVTNFKDTGSEVNDSNNNSQSDKDMNLLTTEESTESTESATTAAEDSNVFELSAEQKKIVIRLMKLLEEDIEYKYQNYADTGYPNDKYWISTDVISVVLHDCGYDLMELMYQDMSEHVDAYPMDLKGSKSPDKKADFRIVYFQQKFFQRNALELPNDFEPNDPTNILQWQPGDIVYFSVDPDNPGKDVAGMVSNNKNEKGIPFVIMITSELGKISEVDALTEMEVSGHYRYPYPELS
jgi:uncharacterized protein YijF (DUF1287 family)